MQALIPDYSVQVPTLNQGYKISSAESRTIWLNLSAEQFNELFHTTLLNANVTSPDASTYSFYTWAGSLSLPGTISDNVLGFWLEGVGQTVSPTPTNSAAVKPEELGSGNLGAGNGGTQQGLYPSQVAAAYQFPLTINGVAETAVTPAVGLIEPSVGSTLFDYINQYRNYLGLNSYTSDQFNIYAPDNAASSGGEATLDTSIVASVVPNSSQFLYGSANGDLYVAYQSAIWDTVNNPSVLTSSYTSNLLFNPNSPAGLAFSELLVDAQLRNVSVFIAAGDGGSQSFYGTGSPLVVPMNAGATAVIVGGTSLSSYGQASGDDTLEYWMQNQNNPTTLLQLISGGLTVAPAHMDPSDYQTFIETVWNAYVLNGSRLSPSYLDHKAGAGGVDAAQTTPSFQSEFGVAFSGRGTPDVSAMAGGNNDYLVLNASYDNTSATSLIDTDGGTSAATPLWASLTAQFNAIFQDQGLPNLGYYTDLLYMAAAVAPGSFNDITVGNNTSTFYYYTSADASQYKDYVITVSDYKILATDQGYEAGPGYDLTSGLGTPNGLLLARALTAIAHAQVGGFTQPDVVSAVSPTTAIAQTAESLLVQATGSLGSYKITAGSTGMQGEGDGSVNALTSQVVEKMMLVDFDPLLVQMLDGAAQATPHTITAHNGDAISASVAGVALGLYQTALTASFGFAAFGGYQDGVTVARPVAVAETVSSDATDAVVRVRQGGTADTTLMFYKVDDLSGAIGSLVPGSAGYEAAAARAAYGVASGGTTIAGPGFGAYAQTTMSGVHDGDIIAMKLTSTIAGVTNTYWGFAQGNELAADGAHVTHLWNYGLNTWGWEDLAGGGDKDYNDLMVQLDFTSTSGHQWLL